MMNISHAFTKAIAIFGVFFLLLNLAFYTAGARINVTKSIPLGLYWISNSPIKKGDYVLWCAPKTKLFDDAKERGYMGYGFCPGGYGYMMKKILAAKNDIVTVSDAGVSVNGKLLPLSKPAKADLNGKPLPKFRINSYKLNNFEVLLMSDINSLSFDSRYFGFINISQIESVIRPVFTW